MNYSEIIAENKKRRMSFTEPYDPVTGEGSDVIPRKEIKNRRVRDSTYTRRYVRGKWLGTDTFPRKIL